MIAQMITSIIKILSLCRHHGFILPSKHNIDNTFSNYQTVVGFFILEERRELVMSNDEYLKELEERSRKARKSSRESLYISVVALVASVVALVVRVMYMLGAK